MIYRDLTVFVRLHLNLEIINQRPDPDPRPRSVMVIATALAAKADVIATGDQDLLVLHPWQGIRILNAADALQLVQSKEG